MATIKKRKVTENKKVAEDMETIDALCLAYKDVK